MGAMEFCALMFRPMPDNLLAKALKAVRDGFAAGPFRGARVDR